MFPAKEKLYNGETRENFTNISLISKKIEILHNKNEFKLKFS